MSHPSGFEAVTTPWWLQRIRMYVCQTDAHGYAAKNRVDSHQYGPTATYTYAKSGICECAVADSGTYTRTYVYTDEREREARTAPARTAMLNSISAFSAFSKSFLLGAIRISWVILHRKLRTCVSFERHRHDRSL